FLGFTENSGGLFIEKNYLTEESRFKENESEIANFIQKYQISLEPNKKIFFLFGYESNIWDKWIDIWNQLDIDYELWIAGKKTLHSITNKKINTQALPFVNQTDFDKLLWLSDIAVVRGEDSFIRAQLAGVPFFWHIYPQENQFHLRKLSAFWNKTKTYYDSEIFFHQQRLSLELNQGVQLSNKERYISWKKLLEDKNNWQQNAQSWKNYLFSQSSAYEKLTQFIKKQLK
ncbi:MAG: elongation factor P maturation arginine rhamnosyltransferase EarP, partial [Neisseriaceae bacterium]|nr:elongation factor P maturation arginine rhamnosyltransferase EarP [Neisseriaceae bacterium]